MKAERWFIKKVKKNGVPTLVVRQGKSQTNIMNQPSKGFVHKREGENWITKKGLTPLNTTKKTEF